MLTDEQFDKIVSKMAYLCARREYCCGDILRKLRRMEGVEEQDAAKVIAKLVEMKYIDDARYALAYARDKADLAGWGRTKIAYALRGKGVEAAVIDAVLQEVGGEKAHAKMDSVIRTKWKALKEEDVRVKMQKVLRFALGRGYGYDEALEAVKALAKNEIEK